MLVACKGKSSGKPTECQNEATERVAPEADPTEEVQNLQNTTYKVSLGTMLSLRVDRAYR